MLTIAAAAAMSKSSVITNEDGWLKKGYKNDLCRCKFAVMNPELTVTLPQYQTMSGCVDILMHTMERYFGEERSMELTGSDRRGLMRTVIHHAHVLMSDPENYESRAEIMWANSLSHNDLTGCGGSGTGPAISWSTSSAGCLTSPTARDWPRYGAAGRVTYTGQIPRVLTQLAVNVLGVPNRFDDPERTALEGIEAMEASIALSVCRPRSGNWAWSSPRSRSRSWPLNAPTGRRTIGGFRVLEQQDIEEIYRMARGIKKRKNLAPSGI